MSLQMITKDRRFWPLFWTQFLGALNDNFFKNAIVMLITYRSVQLWGLDSSSLVAMAGGVFIFPFFLFSATAGQLADRYEKSTMIQITKVSELIIMSFAGLGLYLENYQLLLLVLFGMGAQSAFFGPLKYGILPRLLPSDKELVRGNAYVSGGTFVSILIGTILGGLATTSPESGKIISLGVVILAFIGILTSKFIQKVHSADDSVAVDFTLIPSTWKIMRSTFQPRNKFYSILGVSSFWFLGAAILSLLPPLVKNEFSGDGHVATIFLATFTIGMGIGSYACDRISQKRIELGIVPIASLGMTIFLAVLSLSGKNWDIHSFELMTPYDFFSHTKAWPALLSLLLVSFFGALFIIPQMCFIQRISQQDQLARTIGGNNIWNTLFMVTAAILVMLFNLFKISTSEQILIFGLINMLSGILLFPAYSHEFWRFIAHLYSITFYRPIIHGQDNIPETGGAVLACNHLSFVDWSFLMNAANRPVHFVIDHSYYFKRGARFWLDQAGLIPIATRRESEEILAKAFGIINNHLKAGHILGLFPEGHISKDGEMQRFQPGINRIIREGHCPVIPIAIFGLWGSFFSRSGRGAGHGPIFGKRKKIFIEIGAPIPPDQFELKYLETQVKNLYQKAKERSLLA